MIHENDPYVNADNQLFLEMVGLGDVLNPFAAFSSGARKVMTGKFYCQHPSLLYAEPRRFYTGVEYQLADCDVGVSMPEDGSIIKIIDKYKPSVGKFNIAENSTSYIIWEKADVVKGKSVRVIDLLEVKSMYDAHSTLGFKFKKNPIVLNRPMKKGDKLTTIPTITKEGQYCYGVEANITFISDPAATEDGAVISRSLQRKLSTIVTGSRTASWGKKYYALNIHGDKNTYKPILDIGDKVPANGLVMVLREYDPLFDIANMTDDSLDFDGVIYDTDKTIYGTPHATVYDVTVTKCPRMDFSRIPLGMNEQIDFYDDQRIMVYNELLKFHDSLKRTRGESFILGYELNRMIREAIAFVRSDKVIKGGSSGNKSCRFSLANVPMDDVTVEIKYASVVQPTNTFKLTTCHGGKAVVCSVREDEDMPVDASGRRADIILDDASVSKRMIPGVLYEQLFNATRDDTTREIKRLMDGGDYASAWNLIDKFYEIVAPDTHELAKGLYVTDDEKREHLTSIYKSGIYCWLPPTSASLKYETIGRIKEELPLTYGPVIYTSVTGEREPTKANCLIGSVYLMLLDKIGDTWSSVADAKLQHHGLISKVPPNARHLTPCKQGGVRISGESETRLFLSALGAEVTAELHDRSNNPETNRYVLSNLLCAAKPSNIENAVDRKVVPLGGHRALSVIEHFLECVGVRFKINYDYYKEYK